MPVRELRQSRSARAEQMCSKKQLQIKRISALEIWKWPRDL